MTATLSAHGSNDAVSLYAGQKLVSSAHVDANGRHVFTIKPSATTAYRVAYAGDSSYAAKTSAPVTVDVIYRITERMAGGYATKAGFRECHCRATCAARAHTGCPTFTATVASGMGGKGVEGIPMRIKVGGVPPTRTALGALGTWHAFKVTA